MNSQEIVDYVMNTPHNTNPAILKQKIEDISGASSWNDLTDKPFGEEAAFEPIVWDGNTAGLESIEFVSGTLCKIREYFSLASPESVSKIHIRIKTDGEQIDQILPMNATLEEHGWFAGDLIIASDGELMALGNVKVPRGIWCMNFIAAGAEKFEITVYPGVICHQIDPKYLPDSIKGGANIVVVSFSTETMMLDHTPEEIEAMQNEGKVVLFYNTGTIFQCGKSDGIAYAKTSMVLEDNGEITFITFNFDANGRPTNPDRYLLTATKQ